MIAIILHFRNEKPEVQFTLSRCPTRQVKHGTEKVKKMTVNLNFHFQNKCHIEVKKGVDLTV